MGERKHEHLIDGKFQSNKYPTCPRGKVPLSCEDQMAQDLLWEYALRRRAVDVGFSDDLKIALINAGYRHEILTYEAEDAVEELQEWEKWKGRNPSATDDERSDAFRLFLANRRAHTVRFESEWEK
jgi:hypothetical protein